MSEENRIRITPRARAIYTQLMKSKDDNARASLMCALTTAVGLMPWQYISDDDLLAAFEKRKRV